MVFEHNKPSEAPTLTPVGAHQETWKDTVADLWKDMSKSVLDSATRAAVSGTSAVADDFANAGHASGDTFKQMAHAVGVTGLDKAIDTYHDLKNDYLDRPIANMLRNAGDGMLHARFGPPDPNATEVHYDSPNRIDQVQSGYPQSDAALMLNNFSISDSSMSGEYRTREQLRDDFIKSEHKI